MVGIVTDQKLRKLKPFVAMIFLQFGTAGNALIAKAALNQGMSHYSFVAYRYAVAAILFSPFAYVFERKVRPGMTVSIFIKIVLLSLLEPVIDQNLYYLGMKYTTATFAAAMCNVLPAITFLLAWIFKFEKVSIRKLHSQAKILGTIVTVGGAMILTVVKGPAIEMFWAKGGTGHNAASSSGHSELVKGALLIIVGLFCWSFFVILQAHTLKSFPAELSLTSLICLMGSLEGAAVALVAERGNTAIWAIGFDIKLLAAVYSGILNSGVAYYVQAVVIKDRGPVFSTSFNPLSLIIITILGSVMLGEQLHVGGVIGAVVIVSGLYLVIWGKRKDLMSRSGDDQLPIEAQKTSNETAVAEMASHQGNVTQSDEAV
uniref:WAT1-related protein n=2 Tax=Kalanchoe fedtschenkoi TaxID=63787 RepID=A0A7N0UCM5_KALFE